jgi:hypothetical protein
LISAVASVRAGALDRQSRDGSQQRWEIAAFRFKSALLRWAEQGHKAGFDPNQPRDDRGRWSGGSDGSVRPPDVGHNQGPPLEDPPKIPKAEPPTAKAKNDFLKAAARWLAAARALGARVSGFIAAYQALSWLDTDRPFIESYQDPPKSLEELQDAAQGPRQRGYHDHHIAEQDAAREAGFPEEMVDGPENKVRIPALKHWEITGWYMTKNEKFGGRSPREYLHDQEWAERRRVGLEALIEHKVLRP